MKQFLILGLILLAQSTFGQIPKECHTDRECLIELPESTCADGTASFFTLTKRANASNVLIYLHGGGACWNQESCQKGYAKPLTRVENPTDWNQGTGIFNRYDRRNPFGENYHIVTIPYCTGDIYTGDRVIDYGTTQSPLVLRHRGYENVRSVLNAVKKLYPTPEKVAMVGCSAGGIGAIYHLRNLVSTFPTSKKYVLSDAGTPFKPPFLKEANYRMIMRNWGAESTLPPHFWFNRVSDFGQLVEYNSRQFPEVRFGFISSYRDRMMTFFALAVGSPSPFTAIKENIIHVAETHLTGASNSRVYYTDSSTHCHTPIPLSEVSSLDKNLGDWLREMVDDSGDWASIRPDKVRSVWSALDAGEFQTLP